MARTILGSVVGGIILLIWGLLAWAVLPIHNDTIKNLPNEEAVVGVLSTIQEEGVYGFPGRPQGNVDQAAVNEKYRRGPMGMIVFNPKGGDPNMVSNLIIGLIIYIVSALIAIWFFRRSTALTGAFLQRVSYFGMLGVFLAIATYIVDWNWVGYPLSFSLSMAFDTVVGWILAGIGIVAVIKQPREVVAEAAHQAVVTP